MQIKFLILGIATFISTSLIGFPFFNTAQQYTIMIDPAGDAATTGRQLDDAFERGITLQCAERLKAILEERNRNVTVIITRQPGEFIAPLQNANFANRMDTHLFLTLNFYQETATKPKIYLYHFSYGDEAVATVKDLAFYPYDQAYLFSTHTTRHMITGIHQGLNQHKKLFDCKGPYKLPLKSLIGIKGPAIVIEAGLKQKDDWVQLVEPLVASVEGVIKT